METAPRPEPAQLVHSSGWAGQADWAVTSLPSGLPEAAGKSPRPARDSPSAQLSRISESKQLMKRKLVSVSSGETEA